MKFVCSGRACFSCVFILLSVLSGQSPQLLAIPRSSSPEVTNQVDLQIVVLEGEDGVNVIKNKTAVKPVVEVRDKNKGPGAGVIAGGVVLFVLPEKGASGTFPNGWRWAQVTTDADGRAVAPEIRPNGKGSFKIEIRASYQGMTVTRLITQTNFSTIAEAQKAGKTPGSSTHDSVENESSQQAQNTGQSETQAGSSSASETDAQQSRTEPGKAAPKGSSHAGAWILGTVLAGGVVAGAVEAASLLKQKNCGSAPSICSIFDPNYQACVANFQQQLANYCSCNGFPSGHDLGGGNTCP